MSAAGWLERAVEAFDMNILLCWGTGLHEATSSAQDKDKVKLSASFDMSL